MITFTEARQLVYELFAPHWKPEMGELITLPRGYENATHYQVVVGAREAEDDPDFSLFDGPIPLVDKETGEIQVTDFLSSLELLEAMTPVGRVIQHRAHGWITARNYAGSRVVRPCGLRRLAENPHSA